MFELLGKQLLVGSRCTSDCRRLVLVTPESLIRVFDEEVGASDPRFAVACIGNSIFVNTLLIAKTTESTMWPNPQLWVP